MNHLRAWLVAWVALWWLWMLLVGEWNHEEWIAAAGAATVAATVGEIARTSAGVRARVSRRFLTRGWTALVTVFTDFAIVMWALVRSVKERRVVRGRFRSHTLVTGGDDPEGVGARVWINMLANYSPNAYVVDIDPAGERVLLHDLVPRRESEKPA